MSDYLERVEIFCDLAKGMPSDWQLSHVSSSDGEQLARLTFGDLRALLADAKQLRALRPEYGVDATRLTQIRDRSQRLAEIPFDHHDDANHIITDLIDSAADVAWLIKQLDQTRTDLVRTKRELDRRLGPVGDRD